MHVEINSTVGVASPRMLKVQRPAEKVLRRALGPEEADHLIANRLKRDGQEAHITLLTPQDTGHALKDTMDMEDVTKQVAVKRISEMAEALPDSWKALGVGRAVNGDKVAYFVVVSWHKAQEFRATLGLDPTGQDFHITVGFGDTGDVHGVPKNRVMSLQELQRS